MTSERKNSEQALANRKDRLQVAAYTIKETFLATEAFLLKAPEIDSYKDPLDKLEAQVDLTNAKLTLNNLKLHSPHALETIEERTQRIIKAIDVIDQSEDRLSRADLAFSQIQRLQRLGLVADEKTLEQVQTDYNAVVIEALSEPKIATPSRKPSGIKIDEEERRTTGKTRIIGVIKPGYTSEEAPQVAIEQPVVEVPVPTVIEVGESLPEVAEEVSPVIEPEVTPEDQAEEVQAAPVVEDRIPENPTNASQEVKRGEEKGREPYVTVVSAKGDIYKWMDDSEVIGIKGRLIYAADELSRKEGDSFTLEDLGKMVYGPDFDIKKINNHTKLSNNLMYARVWLKERGGEIPNLSGKKNDENSRKRAIGRYRLELTAKETPDKAEAIIAGAKDKVIVEGAQPEILGGTDESIKAQDGSTVASPKTRFIQHDQTKGESLFFPEETADKPEKPRAKLELKDSKLVPFIEEQLVGLELGALLELPASVGDIVDRYPQSVSIDVIGRFGGKLIKPASFEGDLAKYDGTAIVAFQVIKEWRKRFGKKKSSLDISENNITDLIALINEVKQNLDSKKKVY